MQNIVGSSPTHPTGLYLMVWILKRSSTLNQISTLFYALVIQWFRRSSLQGESRWFESNREYNFCIHISGVMANIAASKAVRCGFESYGVCKMPIWSNGQDTSFIRMGSRFNSLYRYKIWSIGVMVTQVTVAHLLSFRLRDRPLNSFAKCNGFAYHPVTVKEGFDSHVDDKKVHTVLYCWSTTTYINWHNIPSDFFLKFCNL